MQSYQCVQSRIRVLWRETSVFFAFFSLDRWFVQIGLLTDCNKLLVVQRRWGKIPQSTKQKATKGQMWWSIWFYEHSKHLLPQNCLDGLRRLSQRTVYSFPWFHFKVHWIYLESSVDKKIEVKTYLIVIPRSCSSFFDHPPT